MAHTTQPHAASGGHHGRPSVGHLVPASTLIATGFALLVLTVITVAVRYIDVGEFNIIIAIGIAVVKATLVALFFMHLRWDRPFNLLTFIGCVAFVVLMMAFCMMDTAQYRHLQYVGNAPDVESTLQKNAPGAPVARYVPYTP